MTAESIIRIFILLHAICGGIALLSGGIALIVKKGTKVHKLSGKAFFYSMLFSALIAIVVSTLPKHERLFLFAIGIFSLYFILTGYRAVKFKTGNPNLIDKLISWTMLISGILMVLYSVLSTSIHIVLMVFGALGIVFAIRDIRNYNNTAFLKSIWLKVHLSKMIGGYMSAVTAFLVVNSFLPSMYAWFAPGVIGGIYIVFWLRKLRSV